METFISRHPIFDAARKSVAFELIYRSETDDPIAPEGSNQAASKAIADIRMLLGVDRLTDGKRAFVKLPQETIINGHASMLPKELTTIELLSTVEPTDELINICQQLKSEGYTFAINLPCSTDNLSQLIELSDYIKVDTLSFDETTQLNLIKELAPHNKRFLADQVENHEDFNRSEKLGYTYFQGYFTSKPSMLALKDIPSIKLNYLKLVQELNKPNLNFSSLEKIIKLDVSLTFKLLRFINSAQFGISKEVQSIKHALNLLGEQAIKKWASLIAFSNMSTDKPEELMVLAVTRGRFCEAVASTIGLGDRSEEIFLMGMASLLDAILDRPLKDILKDLPLAQDVKAALLGEPNALHDLYKYTLAYEEGNWHRVWTYAAKLETDETKLPMLYMDAVSWADQNIRRGALA
jgi:c-di-GMP-related signal transduction protein